MAENVTVLLVRRTFNFSCLCAACKLFGPSGRRTRSNDFNTRRSRNDRNSTAWFQCSNTICGFNARHTARSTTRAYCVGWRACSGGSTRSSSLSRAFKRRDPWRYETYSLNGSCCGIDERCERRCIRKHATASDAIVRVLHLYVHPADSVHLVEIPASQSSKMPRIILELMTVQPIFHVWWKSELTFGRVLCPI